MLAGEFGSRKEVQSGLYNQNEAGKCPHERSQRQEAKDSIEEEAERLKEPENINARETVFETQQD